MSRKRLVGIMLTLLSISIVQAQYGSKVRFISNNSDIIGSNPSIYFRHIDNNEYGRLTWNGTHLDFEGDLTESARTFIRYVNGYHFKMCMLENGG